MQIFFSHSDSINIWVCVFIIIYFNENYLCHTVNNMYWVSITCVSCKGICVCVTAVHKLFLLFICLYYLCLLHSLLVYLSSACLPSIHPKPSFSLVSPSLLSVSSSLLTTHSSSLLMTTSQAISSLTCSPTNMFIYNLFSSSLL